MFVLPAALALMGANNPQPPLGEPVAVTANDIIASPSAAVKSAVLDAAESQPAKPVSFDFICMASAEGAIFDCIPGSNALPPKATWLDFIRIAGVDEKKSADHSLVALARLQARRTVLRERTGSPKTYLIRLSETLDPAAHVELAKPTRVVTSKELHFATVPDGRLMSRLYPMAALRNGTGARVTARCRVQNDLSLFCYGGKTNESVRPGDAEDFVMATYQLWSAARVDPKTVDGQDAVGAEAELSINWQLGD
jgi:hypothetical protein